MNFCERKVDIGETQTQTVHRVRNWDSSMRMYYNMNIEKSKVQVNEKNI